MLLLEGYTGIWVIHFEGKWVRHLPDSLDNVSIKDERCDSKEDKKKEECERWSRVDLARWLVRPPADLFSQGERLRIVGAYPEEDRHEAHYHHHWNGDQEADLKP